MGYFHTENSEEELAFKFSVSRINKDVQILPEVQLKEVIEHVSQYDSFNTSKRGELRYRNSDRFYVRDENILYLRVEQKLVYLYYRSYNFYTVYYTLYVYHLSFILVGFLAVCDLASQGIGGIVGPPSPETASVVQSICNMLEIPHIKIHPDTSSQPSNFSVNLFPPPEVLSRVRSHFHYSHLKTVRLGENVLASWSSRVS